MRRINRLYPLLVWLRYVDVAEYGSLTHFDHRKDEVRLRPVHLCRGRPCRGIGCHLLLVSARNRRLDCEYRRRVRVSGVQGRSGWSGAILTPHVYPTFLTSYSLVRPVQVLIAFNVSIASTTVVPRLLSASIGLRPGMSTSAFASIAAATRASFPGLTSFGIDTYLTYVARTCGRLDGLVGLVFGHDPPSPPPPARRCALQRLQTGPFSTQSLYIYQYMIHFCLHLCFCIRKTACPHAM